MLCPECLSFLPAGAPQCPDCGLAPARAPDGWWHAYPPLRFLASQRNLPAILARRNLLGLRLPVDEAQCEGLRRGLLLTQLAGGSWNASLGWTVWRLYQLHLLGVNRHHPAVRRALAWIYARLDAHGEFHERDEVVNSYPTVMGEELAIAKRGVDLHGYALAHLLPLGLADEAPLRAAAEFLLARYPGGRRCCPRCTANLLAALALIPGEEARARGLSGLAWLASVQRDGAWRNRGGPLFYFILYALGEWPEAREQLERSLPLICRLRRPDGAWGHTQRAEKTLVVVEALARHGLLHEVARNSPRFLY